MVIPVPPVVARPVRPRSPKGRAREVARRLAETYPDAVCELDHANPFELLTATILSAQTTDVRVNMVTPALFAKYPSPEDLARADPADVEEIIRSTGFYQNKTKSLIGMATALVERFGGEVPTKLEDLVTIPGVGRKTANVVRSVGFDLPGLPVDTHVTRLSRRLGLTTHDDPVKIELELNRYLPAPRAGEVQPADDPPRAARLLRPKSRLRLVLARGHLPVEPPAAPLARASPPASGGRGTLTCLGNRRVYDEWTNQVPATWFAATAGIRRLASPERRPLPPGAVAAFRHRFSRRAGEAGRLLLTPWRA